MEGMLKLVRRCLLAGVALTVLAIPATAAANSVPNTALINGDSVEPSEEESVQIKKEGVPISLEQYAAERAGFTVKVVTGAEWEAMSSADFAQYQVLIVGDPNCGGLPESVTNSVANWAPAVMGSGDGGVVGNRTVIGTDPEDHYQYGNPHANPRVEGEPQTAGAEHLVQASIQFAGTVVGATGISYDTSCGFGGGPTSYTEQLQQISTGPGVWEQGPGPACSANISLIASNPTFSIVTDEDLEGWSCSAHVSFKSFPADWHALALTLPESGEGQVCGTDIETKEVHCGNAYVLVAGGGVVVENPFIKLTPPSGSQQVGGTHTVTATVEEEEVKVEEKEKEPEIEARAAAKPAITLIKAAGKVVNFAVTGQNGGVAGTCTTGGGTPDPECKTDANGQVEFTYPDAKGAGSDTINASVQLPNGLQTTTASWDWTPVPAPAPAPVAVVAGTKTVSPPPATGTAHLASSRACVAASGYLASVSGKGIASVTYVLDGHTLKTIKHASHGAYSLRIKVSSGRAHHLSVHVKFTAASHTSAKTLHKTLARCAARVIAPRFTG
jgi:hypothetical protein